MPNDEPKSALSDAERDRLLALLSERAIEHAMMLLDLDGRIAWWSAGAEQIFGIAREAAIGQPVAKLFVDEDVALGMAEHEIAVAKSGGSAEDDRWMRRGDGSRFWANGVMLGLRDEDGRCVALGKILRNRTDLKEQIETLRNAAGELRAASERKDVFLATLAHELRGPLAPLRNAAALVRMTTRDNAELEQPLRVIERQVDALARLVDDLLDLGRIGAGKVQLQRRPVALQDVIKGAVEMCAPIVQERRHRLEVISAPGPIVVGGDAGRLQQVFVNLITNAAKYTPNGGTVWVKSTIEGEEAVVDVDDTGIGIAPEMLPRIFDLFTQADAPSGEPQHGLGIGLSLVKQFVTLHGGSVQVRSEGRGKGSKFTVRLPLGTA